MCGGATDERANESTNEQCECANGKRRATSKEGSKGSEHVSKGAPHASKGAHTQMIPRIPLHMRGASAAAEQLAIEGAYQRGCWWDVGSPRSVWVWTEACRSMQVLGVVSEIVTRAIVNQGSSNIY